MTLMHIAIAGAAALLYSWLIPGRWRGWTLMIASIVAVYWLSPALTIRALDFVLPTGTLVLAAAAWWFTRPADQAVSREDRIALGMTAALVLGLAATRYLAPELRPTPSRAPDVLAVGAGLAIAAGLVLVTGRLLKGRPGLLNGAILFIVALFVIVKAEPLAVAAAQGLRTIAGQSPELARPADLTWLGLSYVTFRLIHLLRDRQAGKLPALSLRENLTYVVFFPALVAGPIDRAERHLKDDRALPDMRGLDPARITEGVSRIFIGIFKKFVIADSLALLALDGTNALQATSAGGTWLLLYGYAFRLLLDFSGYSDVAIGIGILFGIHLPENFNRPYLKQSIAAFWQSWHITLSNWVRFYVFSPLSRALMKRDPKPSALTIVFIAQLVTMVTIGLWHGITWTFVIWGLWHGVGLFVHKWWSDRTRKWYLGLRQKPRLQRIWTAAGIVITFQFVVLGWVWFALPDVNTAWTVFLKLFGIEV